MSTDDSRREPTENWDDDFEDKDEDHTLTAINARPPSSSAYTVSSQTLLRPNGQPVHRERERKRLRKKSRPPGPNVFEIMDVGSTHLPAHVDDVYQDATAAPATTSTGGTLLSRIGSVKKWGVRRNKGSSAPTAAPADDSDREPDFEMRLHVQPSASESELTPRPHHRPSSQVSTSSLNIDDLDLQRNPSPSPKTNYPYAYTYLKEKEKSRRRSAGSSLFPSSLSASPSPSPSSSPAKRSTHAHLSPTAAAAPRTTSGSTQHSATSGASWFTRSVSASHTLTSVSSAGSPSASAVFEPVFERERGRRAGRPGTSLGLSREPSTDAHQHTANGHGAPAVDLRKTPTRPRTPNRPRTPTHPRVPLPMFTLPAPSASSAHTTPSPPSTPPQHTHTPAKLIKRKSLGFVQLKLGLGGHAAGADEDAHGHGYRQASPSKVKSWARLRGDGPGARAEEASGQPQPHEQSQHPAQTPPQGTSPPAPASPQSSKSPTLSMGMRGFLGGVRRISIGPSASASASPTTPTNTHGAAGVGPGAGRHRKSKSGGGVVRGTEDMDGWRDRGRPGAGGDSEVLPPIALHAPPPAEGAGPQHARRAVPGSPGLTSSLGRASAGAGVAGGPGGSGGERVGGRSASSGAGAMRRNSLGDLKIPERISQAQVGLRRDLGMVREFAANIEQLKELQGTYRGLVVEVQNVLDAHASVHHQHQQQQQQEQPRAGSPAFLAPSSNTTTTTTTTVTITPKSRSRSNTIPVRTATPAPAPSPHSQLAYKHLASAFYTINSKYRISWECAELLIELGGGAASSASASAYHEDSGRETPPLDVDLKLNLSLMGLGKKGSGGGGARERAITLAGDESMPPSPISGPGSASPTGAGAGAGGAGEGLALGWRASTGRHDLSHRQLVLLREMLQRTESASSLSLHMPYVDEGSASGPREEEERGRVQDPALSHHPQNQQILSPVSLNRDWRWGDAMGSTITLPSEESGSRSSADPRKKRKQGKLGMMGIRDMLRALKRSYAHTEPPLALPPPPAPPLPRRAHASTTSLSTQDNASAPSGRRRAKTSFGPESMKRMGRPATASPASLNVKSPRRPSLASIFRIGHKSRQAPPPPRSASSQSKLGSSGAVSAEEGEEDWDRIDSVEDLDGERGLLGLGLDAEMGAGAEVDGDAGMGAATVRGRASPYLSDTQARGSPPPLPSFLPRPPTPTPKRSASASSIFGAEPSVHGNGTGGVLASPPAPGARGTRLSNVEEHVDGFRHVRVRHSNPVGAGYGSASRELGRAPKNGSVRSMPPHLLPDPKLAMTPENIGPLLENAKEVHGRLDECIAEIRSLLSVHGRT